jgi:hypothetical protein
MLSSDAWVIDRLLFKNVEEVKRSEAVRDPRGEGYVPMEIERWKIDWVLMIVSLPRLDTARWGGNQALK